MDYYISFIQSIHKDRNAKKRVIRFVKQGLIAKRITTLESPFLKTICIELTLSKKAAINLFVYKPPAQQKLVNNMSV